MNRTQAVPLVSVIVPVYNVEKYLRQCVDSVLAQTFSGFELILIDDGSLDNCGAICDEYAAQDPRVSVIHQENGGLGHARNVGMDQAVGKYLVFLDSDDYWLPMTLERSISEAENNQTQVLMFGARLFMDGMGEGESIRDYRYNANEGIVQSGADSLRAMLDAREYRPESCLRLFLLDYLRGTGLRFDEGVIFEDVKISFLSYLYAERVECIDAQLYQYRMRSDSIMQSRSIRTSALGYRVSLDGLLDVFFSHSRSLEEEALLGRYCAWRATYICGIYQQALQQRVWKTARWIQRDTRQTMKRVRALPNLPRSIMLATYSLLLSYAVTGAYGKLRLLAIKRSRTALSA